VGRVGSSSSSVDSSAGVLESVVESIRNPGNTTLSVIDPFERSVQHDVEEG
jgi:hypothetical protein